MKKVLSLLVCLMLVVGMLPVAALAADTAVTVYLQNDALWATPYVYAWVSGTNTSMASWPGEAMTKVAGEDNIWSYTVDAGFDMVIFNNSSGSQTADLNLPVDENVLYNNSTNTWGPYQPAEDRHMVRFNLANLTTDGASYVTIGSGYTATLTAGEGYALPETISVTVGGTEIEGYTYADGTVSIPADLITGEVVITASAVMADISSAVVSMTTQSGTVSYYYDLASAIADAAANNGSTLKMLSGVELSAYIDLTAGTYTLDLNGQVISSTAAYVFRMPADSTVNITVMDSKTGGELRGRSNKTGIYMRDGAFTLLSGTISGSTGFTAAKGTLTIKGGTISGSTRAIQANYSTAAEVNIEGGSVVCSGVTDTTYGIHMRYGTLNVSGGSVSGFYGIYAEKGIVRVSGNAEITGTLSSALYLKTSGSIQVSGGTISGTNDIEYNTSATGAVTLTGGTFPGGIKVVNTTLAAILGEGCHYRANGTLVTIADTDTQITDQGDITVHADEESGLFDISFASMTMGNSLAMNFAFEQGHVSDWTGHYAQIMKTYADGREAVVETVEFADWSSATINGTAHYYVTFNGIAAKEMTDDVHVTICNASGEAVSNTWTDSVKAQSMRILDTVSPAEQTMIVDMLNYGAAAQEYFGYGTEELANEELNETQASYASTPKACADGRVQGTNYGATNVNLKSNIQMMFAFRNIDTTMQAVVTFTNHRGVEKTVTIQGSQFTANGNYYVVTVEDLVVADGRQNVTCVVYDGDTVVAEATDSMESYTARKNGSEALFVKMMQYSDSAYAYFHQEG